MADYEVERALIEAVLFLEPDPVDSSAIARASGLSKDVVEELLPLIQEACSSPERGIELIKLGNGYCLSPKRSLWEGLRERYGRRNEARLSRAALETLSIIAYSQPITRAEIEAIRGVSADTMIRLLLDKGLIREAGKKDAPGKPVQYATTKEFLEFFRLGSIADLPKLGDIEAERFELESKEP